MRKLTGIPLVVLLPVGKVGHRVGKMRETGRLVSVSAILSFSYKIRADVLSSALIPFVW